MIQVLHALGIVVSAIIGLFLAVAISKTLYDWAIRHITFWRYKGAKVTYAKLRQLQRLQHRINLRADIINQLTAGLREAEDE